MMNEQKEEEDLLECSRFVVRGDAHVSGDLVEEFCPRNSYIDSIIFGCGETVVFRPN